MPPLQMLYMCGNDEDRGTITASTELIIARDAKSERDIEKHLCGAAAAAVSNHRGALTFVR